MKLPKAFVDLRRLSEDERIRVIGEYCLLNPSEKVAVPTDDEPGKPERYKQLPRNDNAQLWIRLFELLAKGVIVLHVTTIPAG